MAGDRPYFDRVLPAEWLPDGMALITDHDGKLLACIIGDSFHVLTATEQKEMEAKNADLADRMLQRWTPT